MYDMLLCISGCLRVSPVCCLGYALVCLFLCVFVFVYVCGFLFVYVCVCLSFFYFCMFVFVCLFLFVYRLVCLSFLFVYGRVFNFFICVWASMGGISYYMARIMRGVHWHWHCMLLHLASYGLCALPCTVLIEMNGYISTPHYCKSIETSCSHSSALIHVSGVSVGNILMTYIFQFSTRTYIHVDNWKMRYRRSIYIYLQFVLYICIIHVPLVSHGWPTKPVPIVIDFG